MAPVGIVDFPVTTDHLQALLISGLKVRRINPQVRRLLQVLPFHLPSWNSRNGKAST